MASELLSVPEENLEEVINVIENGLKHTKVSRDTKRNLKEWCREEKEYLSELQEED